MKPQHLFIAVEHGKTDLAHGWPFTVTRKSDVRVLALDVYDNERIFYLVKWDLWEIIPV